ncbi:MAG: ABC transporter ATP-binding protein [Candidatus Firestonebacteria bacterium RIFOXYA2_FULL_40_8]|nr:MAG: ABC transporter ATP-binding protein [Candidatus Firestonebacteria bacterium RIFOXYA2_FULL_40_8]
MAKILEVSGLTKRFAGLVALDKVNLDIEKGEIISLIGPNGAGKTTVFNCLTGVYKPTGGLINYLGKPLDLKHHVPHLVAKLGIARTFQNIRLFSNMTVIENVMVSSALREKTSFLDIILHVKGFKIREDSIFRKSFELLQFIGLSDKIYHLASNLAYGEQRKLEIARALATAPVLLLLDEPAAGMNAIETKDLITLIRNIRDKGITVFLIEHDMKMVMSISDRVFVLNYGKNIASGVPSQVQKNELVIEAYLGEKV